MPSARRRHVAVTAPPAAWKELGRLLSSRRRDLGYTYRVPFAAECLPLTHRGNPNTRLVQDIELAAKDRIDHFTVDSLGVLARGYGVTYESMLAVLRGEADQLAPAVPPAPPVPAEPPGWAPPVDDPGRSGSTRPYADRIWMRLRDLAARGVTGPSGDQVFGAGTDEAKVWDGTGASLDLPDRVWLIADLQRAAAARAGNPAGNAAGS